MTIHLHHLFGCAPTPLAHYLKAIGILRLVAQQADAEVAIQKVLDAGADRVREALLVGERVVEARRHAVVEHAQELDLRSQRHVARFVESLTGGYYLDETRIRAAVESRRSFNLIHLATMFKIDVFVAKGRPFDRQALARAGLEQLVDSPEARRFRIASAEDIVLAKLEWFRAGDELSERQWTDVLGVLRTSPQVDTGHLRRWAPELGVADLVERALASHSWGAYTLQAAISAVHSQALPSRFAIPNWLGANAPTGQVPIHPSAPVFSAGKRPWNTFIRCSPPGSSSCGNPGSDPSAGDAV